MFDERIILHKKIFSSAGYLAGASLIEKIGAFIIIPILTKVLSPKEYGDLMLGVSYVGIVMLFIYNGLHSSLFRWYNMWKEEFDKKIYEKYIFTIVNIIALLIVTILISVNFIYPLENILKIDFWLFLAILLSSITSISYNLKSIIWIVENRAYLNLIFIFLKTFLIVIGLYFFIDIYPYSITKPIIEIIVITFLSIYLFYSYIFKYPSLKSVSLQEIKPVIKESLIYGWGLQISQIAFWIITSSDRIMLSSLTNNSFVAYYSILMIGTTIMFIIVAFNNSFSAYYNKMISDNLPIQEVNRYIFIYLLYGFLLILVYKITLYFLSDYVILLLSTKEYLIVSKYMYLTSDILLFYFAYLLFTRYLHAHKLVKSVIAITIVSAIVNLILNYFLIQRYEIIGALIASIIAYFFMAFLSFSYLYKNIEFVYIKKLFFLFFGISIMDILIDIVLYNI